mmetsp:Transcript_4340/g.5461  ORF Transcript_4340/g.5461 Transcript_4340/m.5461 type:complete len:328 (-) Transcript_4340:1260-2243(-)
MEVEQLLHQGLSQPSPKSSDIIEDEVCAKTQNLNLGEIRTNLKSVLSFDCGSKLVPNAVKLLVSVFVKLAKKFHLNQLFSSEDGLQICCSAEGKALQVLFGSAILQVHQSISIVQGTTIKAQLGWYHPFNLMNSGIPVHAQAQLYKKRERFVLLFNGSWQHLLDKIKPLLSISDDSDCDSFNESIYIPVHVHQYMCPKALNLKPVLKTSKSLTTILSSKASRVRFSEEDIVRDVPVAKEDREARMGIGGICTLPGGRLKPLRSPKTGLFIWRDEKEAVFEKVSRAMDLTNIVDNSLFNPIKQPVGKLAIVRKKALIRRDSPKRYRSE